MGGETETYHVAVGDLKRQLKRKYPWLGPELNMWSTAFKDKVRDKLAHTQVGQYDPSVSDGDRARLRQLERQYLFTYVDKGATTFAITCKTPYLQLLDQEIGNNYIYLVSKETMKTLVERSPALLSKWTYTRLITRRIEIKVGSLVRRKMVGSPVIVAYLIC
mgnify:CR=1 FL=1